MTKIERKRFHILLLMDFTVVHISYSSIPVSGEATGNAPGTPQKINVNSSPKAIPASSVALPSTTALKRNSAKSHSTANVPTYNKSDIIPVIVPRTSIRSDLASESRKEVGVAGRTMPLSLQSKATDFRRFPNSREEVDKPTISVVSEPTPTSSKATEFSSVVERNFFPAAGSLAHGIATTMKDERCISSGKQETSSLMDPTASCEPESCMYLIFSKYPFCLFVLDLLCKIGKYQSSF